MKISIAMTTYNGEKYIKAQLVSLLNQTRQADEVIIADDRSTDDTYLIVDAFIAEHHLTNWTFYVNETNLGFVQNFKSVIHKTQGDLIFLCDQDDVWLPEKLADLEELFEHNQQAIAINSSFYFIDNKDSLFQIAQRRNTSNQNIIASNLPLGAFVKIKFSTVIRYNISPGCTMAFRSSIKDMLLSKKEFIIPHDWEINLLACISEGLYFYNKPLINYRIHESNTIGMSTTEPIFSLRIKGDYGKRIQVLDCMLNLYGLLLTTDYLNYANRKDKSFIVHSNRFSTLRSEVLKTWKLSSWFQLWLHLPFIKQKHAVKVILGDLIFLLKLHN